MRMHRSCRGVLFWSKNVTEVSLQNQTFLLIPLSGSPVWRRGMQFKRNETFPEQFKKIKIYPLGNISKEVQNFHKWVLLLKEVKWLIQINFLNGKIEYWIKSLFLFWSFIVGVNYFWLSGIYIQPNHTNLFVSSLVKNSKQTYAKHNYYSKLSVLYDCPKYI